MYLMQLAKLYLRDICFKKCFIKILNSIAKFIACVVTYLCSGGHPRRRHSGQESPATRGGAAARPWAPGHPRWWWRGQSPPLPPPEGERARAQGPRAAHRRAPHLNRQEPPPPAHLHRSRHRRRTRTDDRSSHGGPGSDKEEAGSGPGGRRR